MATFAKTSQPLARMNVSCIAKTEAGSGRGTSGGGGRVALDFFFWRKDSRVLCQKRPRARRILQLDAREAPAGDMEVVLGRDGRACLLHEAVGHGLEADFNRKKTYGIRRTESANASPAKNAPWSTTARCRGAAGL